MSEQMTPQITVLMPAFNPGIHFESALDSILGQSLGSFELLIIDDGTTDGSLDILKDVPDPRIRLITNPSNLGLVATLNQGLELARGSHIARMDSDDVAHPERLARQLSYMQAHPDIAILGTWSRTIGDGVTPWETHHPAHHANIVSQMLFNTGLTHPSVMLDAQQLQAHGLRYRTTNLHAEDYDLWVRACQTVTLANLPELLLDYRIHGKQVSSSHQDAQKQSARYIRESLIRNLGLDFAVGEAALHHRICEYDWLRDAAFARDAHRWLKHLSGAIGKANPELKQAVRDICQSKTLEIHKHVHQRKHRLQRALIKYAY